MENNKKEILKWALENFKNNITLLEQVWGVLETQPYFDFKTILSINGKKYEGRGVDVLQSQAITASIAEALERYAIAHVGLISSSGTAIHSDINIARKNSQRELLERHYVMLFTLGYYNGEIIILKELPIQIEKSIKILEKEEIELTFYKLFESRENTVVLCQASGLKRKSKFGLIFGAGCKENINLALESSLKEVLPNVMACLNNNLTSIHIGEFENISQPRPEDHLRLYLDLDFSLKYLHSRKLIRFEDERLNSEEFVSVEIDYPYSSLYPVINSSHPRCYNAQWGFLKNTTLINNNPIFPFVLP